MRRPLHPALFTALGLVFLALAGLGALLPVLPTTPFVLLALWALAKGSPRLHAYLLNHRRFGATARAWEEQRAIPLRGKVLATTTVTLTALYLIAFSELPVWFVGISVALMAYGVAFVLTRPTAKPGPRPKTECKAGRTRS
ncbi:YbaN family protein [Oceanithermus sp.]